MWSVLALNLCQLWEKVGEAEGKEGQKTVRDNNVLSNTECTWQTKRRDTEKEMEYKKEDPSFKIQYFYSIF